MMVFKEHTEENEKMWFCCSFSALSTKKLQYRNDSFMCACDKQLVISCGQGSGFLFRITAGTSGAA